MQNIPYLYPNKTVTKLQQIQMNTLYTDVSWITELIFVLWVSKECM